MAKFIPGPAVASVSGSVGGTVFSRNRGGAYMRNRAVPITSTTSYALAAKTRLADASQDWQGLTAAQRASWRALADSQPVINSLGAQVRLTGHQLYVGVNSRLAADGQSAITDPPIIPAPDPLTSMSATYDIGTGAMEITFAPTPLPAGVKLWILAALTNSPGINFVQNLLRFIGTSAAAQASAYDYETLITARLGAPVVGQQVHLQVATFDTATGLLSGVLRADGTVVST